MTEIRCRMKTAQYGLYASGKTYEDDYSESRSKEATCIGICSNTI